MVAQRNHYQKSGRGFKGKEREAAKQEARAQIQQEREFKEPMASPRIRRSEFAKLENYVLGSSAAIITNVSLIVGLGSARAGKGPILGGLLTIALADNISDSLGIQMYKESEGFGEKLSSLATVLNFLSRLLVSLSFVAIVLILPTSQAIIVGILWALLLLNFVSYLITRRNRENSILEIAKHVLVALIVIALSRWVGSLIAEYF